jgi:hypothetical protein
LHVAHESAATTHLKNGSWLWQTFDGKETQWLEPDCAFFRLSAPEVFYLNRMPQVEHLLSPSIERQMALNPHVTWLCQCHDPCGSVSDNTVIIRLTKGCWAFPREQAVAHAYLHPETHILV